MDCNCRSCRLRQTDHDEEWCETGEMNRADCQDYAPTRSEVQRKYRLIADRNQYFSQCMRTVGHS